MADKHFLEQLVVGQCTYCLAAVTEAEAWGPGARELDSYPPKVTPVYHLKCHREATVRRLEAEHPTGGEPPSKP